MVSPALTVPWSATLVSPREAQLTTIGTGPTVGLPSLLEVTEALLLTVPQVALVVGLVMWTWTLAPAARSAGPKLSTPALIEKPALELAASMVQLSPALV